MKINMEPSNNFTNLMIEFEGEKLVGYLDSAGLLTIGIGHLVEKGEPYKLGHRITLAESRILFAHDTEFVVAAVNRLVKTKINQNQFDALCSLTFNIGINGLGQSSVLKHVNDKNFKLAADSFHKWDKAAINGELIVVHGLTIRRQKEAALFLK